MDTGSKLRINYPSYLASIDLPTNFPFVGGYYNQPDRPIESLHYHNHFEIGFCWDGHGIFVVGGQIFSYKTYTFCFIPPGIAHLAQSQPGTHSRWSFFYFDPYLLLRETLSHFSPLDRYTDPHFPYIQPHGPYLLFHTIQQELEQNLPHSHQIILAELIKLLVYLERNFPNLQPQQNRDIGSACRIAPAIHSMLKNYTQPLSCKELAKKCHLSLPQFRRHFYRVTGTTPLNYLNRIRVHYALHLFSSQPDAKVHQIAEHVGFDSATTLYRQMIKHTGHPPSYYLKRHKKRNPI